MITLLRDEKAEAYSRLADAIVPERKCWWNRNMYFPQFRRMVEKTAYTRSVTLHSEQAEDIFRTAEGIRDKVTFLGDGRFCPIQISDASGLKGSPLRCALYLGGLWLFKSITRGDEYPPGWKSDWQCSQLLPFGIDDLV